MLLTSRITPYLTVISLIGVSSLVQAQAQAITSGVSLQPVASAAAVPALGSGLLIVLGLLLAVIAARTLRSDKTAQKLLSVAVLGGGLMLSGLGVDRALAAIAISEAIISGDGCTNPHVIPYTSDSTDTMLINECPNSMKIEGFLVGGCNSEAGYALDLASANCKVGQVLSSGGSCEYLPRCFPVD